MNLNGLRCTACGGELEMNVVFDGMSDEAVSYDAKYFPKWGWLVELECTKCPRVYHIARTPDSSTVSAIKESNTMIRRVSAL